MKNNINKELQDLKEFVDSLNPVESELQLGESQLINSTKYTYHTLTQENISKLIIDVLYNNKI